MLGIVDTQLMVTTVSEAQHEVIGMEISNLTYRGLTSGTLSTKNIYTFGCRLFLHVKNNEVTWLALLKGKSTIWVEGRCF